MEKNTLYDFIIAGSGCAGLSLAVQLSRSKVSFQKVLLVDRGPKTHNDRSWCFWAKDKSAWYSPVICKSWDRFRFRAPGFDRVFELNPFRYHFIRGIDFYNYCLDELLKDPRFEFIYDDAVKIVPQQDSVRLLCHNGTYEGRILFNSVFKQQQIKAGQLNYVQHFRGWLIEADADCFDEHCPVFMDFETEQENDFRFFYVIPYSASKALIEYTGFSSEPLNDEVYETKLKHYLSSRFKNISYKILESESGLIPMAESEFINPYGSRVINTGTAGGSSKPSTGYTFYFIQKYTAELIRQLESGSLALKAPQRQERFLFYDKILLDVLHRKNLEGRTVFRRLFEKNKVADLLNFLNEESGIGEELRIMGSVEKKEFLFSFFRKLLH